MHPGMNRTALLVSVFSTVLSAKGASAETSAVYPGIVTDERVAKCGVIVSGDEVTRIEPFVEGRNDLEGRLVLDVIKESASGKSQSKQEHAFANGVLGRVSVSTERPAKVTVEMIVTDRSGKALCELRRSMTFESAPTKI